LVLFIIFYTLSSTKLEIMSIQFLPGNEGVVGERDRVCCKGRGRGKWEEMS
jgi:hypothetical protein